MTIDDFRKLIAPMRTRVASMVARATVKMVDDSRKMQLAQVEILDGEIRDGVERVQNYGFTSVPKADAEAVIVRVGGLAAHSVVIAIDDRRYRLTGLADGEVALYDATGSTIILKANGDIDVAPSSGKLNLTGDMAVSGKLDVTGKGTFSDDIDCSGTVTGSTDVVGGGKSLKSHKHSGATLMTTATVSTGSPGMVSGDTGEPE